MNQDNDIALIQKFVQGEISLLANQNLRVEPAFNTAQLLAKRGGLLATAKLVGQIRSVLVRQPTAYQELINRILVENRYIPTGVSEKGFVEYEHRAIPAGYEANFTEVRQLWKIWRTHYSRKQHLPPLLIMTPKGWEAVKTIAYGQENFYVQIAGDEKMLHVSDRLVWLSPVEEEEATQIFNYTPPSQRSKSQSSQPGENFQGFDELHDE